MIHRFGKIFKLIFIFLPATCMAIEKSRQIVGTGMSQSDSSAINMNFNKLDIDDLNSVHKSLTETIEGSKTFTGNVVFSTITVSSATFSYISDSALTSQRVVIAGIGGALQDVSGFTHNGSTLAWTGAATLGSSSGNVGIGTTSPAYKLQVVSSGTDTENIQILNQNGNSSVTTSAGIVFQVTNSVGTTSAKISGSEDSTDAAPCDIIFYTSSATAAAPTEKMRIRGSPPGNVGIGVSNPSYLFEMAGTSPNISSHYNGSASSGNKGRFDFTHNRNSDSTQEILGSIQGIAEDNQSKGGLRVISRNNADVENFRTLSNGHTLFGTSTDGTGLVQVLGSDNGTAMGIKINASQANVTGSDVFVGFYSTTGLEGSIAGTGSAGVLAYNTFTGAHWTSVAVVTDSNSEQALLLAPLCSDGVGLNIPPIPDPVPSTAPIIKANMKSIMNGVPFIVGISTSIPQKDNVKLSPKAQLVSSSPCNLRDQRSIYGFYAGRDQNTGADSVFALGTGYAIVLNEGKNIDIGDWLSTTGDGLTIGLQCVSGTSGPSCIKDDIQHNYSAAKALVPVVWSLGETKRKIAVTYHAG